MAVQWLRGDTASNEAYTGPIASLTVDTEEWELRLHDGVTPGGHVVGDYTPPPPLTEGQVKTLYESNSNTNVFTDGEKFKLSTVEQGAEVNLTNSEVKTAYESNADTNAFTNAEKSKLGGIESGATADQTAAEIKTAYESNPNTNTYNNIAKGIVDSLSGETSWTTLPLSNGWSHIGSPWQSPRYMRDQTGTVFVEALVQGGTQTQDTVIATLPVGFRPSAKIGFCQAASSQSMVLVVNSNGTIAVGLPNPGTAWVSLTLSFKAA